MNATLRQFIQPRGLLPVGQVTMPRCNQETSCVRMVLGSIGATVAIVAHVTSAGAQMLRLYGAVRDGERPVERVVVQVAGQVLDTTGADGSFQIVLQAGRTHTLRFARIGYLTLLAGLEYVIEGGDDGDSTRLDVRWPALSDLVRRVCPEHASHTAWVVGRVRDPPSSPDLEVVAAWKDDPRVLTGPRREPRHFGAMGVPVADDGSFLLCALPSDRVIRLSARLGQAVGAARTVRLRAGEIREVEVAGPWR